MITHPVTDTCVLVAELTGADALAEKLGAGEAERAIERARARAARSVDAFSGHTLQTREQRLIICFARCDNAVLAANDMRERISQLPPVSGISLALRIGVHAGSSDTKTGEPSQGTTSFANQLLALAQRDQILISKEAAGKLSEPIRNQLNTGSPLSLSDNGTATPVYELRGDVSGLRGNQYNTPFLTPTQDRPSEAPARTESSTSSSSLAPPDPRTRLMMRHQSASYIVSQTHPVLLAGREEGNDLVITDRRASRHHARIELRNGLYMLIDTSTNGTYLVDDHGMEIILKRSECQLPERGRIGFGYSPQEIGVESAMFDIGQK